jgi:hypothetical protein
MKNFTIFKRQCQEEFLAIDNPLILNGYFCSDTFVKDLLTFSLTSLDKSGRFLAGLDASLWDRNPLSGNAVYRSVWVPR